MHENVFSMKKYENLFHCNEKGILINVINLRDYRLLNNEFYLNDYIIEKFWIDIISSFFIQPYTNFIRIEIVCLES